MKVVINRCHGGFSLSLEAVKYMANLGSVQAQEELASKAFYGYVYDNERDNKYLVEAVEVLGSDVASGSCAELCVIEVPNNVQWHIAEYNGMEHVAQNHATYS